MGRTLAATLLPAVAITAAWLGLEEPRLVRESAAIAALAILPALVRAGVGRIAAALAAALAAAWLAFGAQPWELLPFRDERVLSPLLEDVAQGVVDFYAVFLPFDPTRNLEMHTLVLCAIFGFTLAASLLVASRRPDRCGCGDGGRGRLARDAPGREGHRLRCGRIGCSPRDSADPSRELGEDARRRER